MKRTVFLAAMLGVVAGGLLTLQLVHHTDAHLLPATVHAQDQRVTSLGFANVVKAAVPAVVNISSTRIIRSGPSSRNRRGAPQEEMPMEEFFERFFGRGPRGPSIPQERRASSLGSGVIISQDGYVLTNNHVVEEASQVKVSLSDRREFSAKVVGTDPQTDIAVLKIEARGLPTVPLSDSARVQVGEYALAIGNPFGIGQTVTMGIVSATGRSLGGAIEFYEDFIQTDAAINQGNSGGALINASGHLIGINTAILSGNAGGNVGIGFAVPINMARESMDQIVKTGKVTRGYMGVGIQDVTQSLADALKLPANTGVLINSVEPDSPAARAGLQVGDVVTSVNGETIANQNAFRLRVARFAPGSRISLAVNREGKQLTLPVTLVERPGAPEEAGPERGESRGATAMSGVEVESLTPEIAQRFRLPSGTAGVVVTDVSPASAAAEAGLRPGDIVQQVNRQPVRTVQDFNRLVRQAGNGPAALLIRRGEGSQFLVVEPRR